MNIVDVSVLMIKYRKSKFVLDFACLLFAK